MAIQDLPSKAEQVRASREREQRLEDYLQGILPAHINQDVAVKLTPHVPTAAVLPADQEALRDAEIDEIPVKEIRHLLHDIDADYLVLVTTRPADTDSLPFDDRLTADRAHQFGLVFHETLHILKTALTGVADVVESEVEEQYQPLVDYLINCIEDGAIEREATEGDNYSDNASVRLEVTRRIHSKFPDDLPDDEQTIFTFWDAVTTYLYENAIYKTGLADQLLNDENDRATFASPEAEQAFADIQSELDAFVERSLQIRSDDTSQRHVHDKEASISRAKEVMVTWKRVLKPVLDEDARNEFEPPEQPTVPDQKGDREEDREDGRKQEETVAAAGGTQSESPNEDRGPNENHDTVRSAESDDTREDTPHCGETSSEVAESHQEPEENSESERQEQETNQPCPTKIDPEALSTETQVTDDPFQDVRSHPDVNETAEPDPANVPSPRNRDSSPEKAPHAKEDDGTDTTDSSDGTGDQDEDHQSNSNESAATVGQDRKSRSRQEGQKLKNSNDEGKDSPPTGEKSREAGDSETPTAPPCEIEIEAEERSRESQIAEATSSKGESEEQSTLANFGPSSTDEEPGDSEPSDQNQQSDSSSENADRQDTSGTREMEPNRERSAPENDRDASPEDRETTETSTVHESDQDGLPDRDVGAESTGTPPRGIDSGEDLSRKELETDHKRAKDTAETATIDESDLESELRDLKKEFEQAQENDSAREQKSSADGAGGGALDSLTVLPESDRQIAPEERESVENGSETVANTLAKVLQLDQQSSTRRGLSSGQFDSKSAYKLSYGDPRSFQSKMPGDEKRYSIVLVLDRSSSMARGNPSKISVATKAVAQFAYAAEELNIEVAVIDFIDSEARLAKPFTVDVEHAQASLLSQANAGGTPLADALALARNLLETRRNEPLIITMNDGKPNDVEAVKSQVKKAYAPICSLTIATDCQRGNPPRRAKQLEHVYERTETVYDEDRLNDRLDQFASLLAGF